MNEILAHASRLTKSGLSVIPIKPDGTKAPDLLTWKPFQGEIADPSTLENWFKNGERGLAVIGGAVSGNLEILDFDDPERAKDFGKLVEQAGRTEFVHSLPMVKTPSGGFHLYYRCQSKVEGNQKLAEKFGPDGKLFALIETRGEGGYVLAPGSPPKCHELGKPYEQLRGDLTAIPTITADDQEFLLNTARSLNQYFKPAKQPPTSSRSVRDGDRPGDQFNEKVTWGEVLEPHDWTFDHQQDETTHWRRPGKKKGTSATTNHDGRDLFYCFTSNGHPFGPGQGYEKFTAFTLLNHGSDFKEATLELVRQGYGSPPEGTRQDYGEQPGEVRTEEPTGKNEDKKESSSHGLQLTPLGDLLNEPEEKIPWLVDQHLPSGGLSVIGGKPKAGKSVLSRCLALDVARGRPFLGFETTQGSVFYLGLEEKRAEVKKHFQAMGATPEDPISVFIAPSPQDGLVQLQEATERERPALIIVDPIFKLVRVKDSNDYAEVSNALEPLLTMARRTGAHVLGVHHLGKGDRPDEDSLLGSTAIFAAVDSAFFLKRLERYRTLASIQRYGEDLEETVLFMDPETKIISDGGTRKDTDERLSGEAILEYLRTESEPVDEKTIQETVEGRKTIKVKALRILVDQEKVLKTGNGKRGDPFLYIVSGFWFPPYRVGNQKPGKLGTTVSTQKQSTYSGSQKNMGDADYLKAGNQKKIEQKTELKCSKQSTYSGSQKTETLEALSRKPLSGPLYPSKDPESSMNTRLSQLSHSEEGGTGEREVRPSKGDL